MILTQEQFNRRLETAIALTAKGLKRGREYTHNGVDLYSEHIVGDMRYVVHHSKTEKFKNPHVAARRFAELAKGLDPSAVQWSKENDKRTIRHGDS